MRHLVINDLAKIREANKTKPIVSNVIGILLDAVNDWPNAIVRLSDYELEVRAFTGNEITQENLEFFLPLIDYQKDAWKAESLSQLIEVFQFFESGKSLNEIISELEQELKE